MVFARARANAQVLANAGHFVRSLEECLPENDPLQSGPPSIRRAIRVLSLAEINEDPIAQARAGGLHDRRLGDRSAVDG